MGARGKLRLTRHARIPAYLKRSGLGQTLDPACLARDVKLTRPGPACPAERWTTRFTMLPRRLR